MGRPSILPELTEKLERYLARAVDEWVAQHVGDRSPTLPLVNNKVNVRRLAELCGFEGSQEQHLFKQPELRSLVNAVAAEQGIEPIGSWLDAPGEGDKVVEKRFRRLQADHSEMSKALAETKAQVERLRQDNESLRARMALLESTGLLMRDGSVG
jgi:hypothetical protein